MLQHIIKTSLIVLILGISTSSYAIDFIKFGTSHDSAFWDTPDYEFGTFPSTRQYLDARGKHETTSIDLNDGNVANVFAGDFGHFDAILVSESIESLSPESYALFNQYVKQGGCFVLTGSHGDEPEFLNNAFGFSISSTDANDGVDAYSLQSSAAITAFAGGPSELIAADHTLAFSNVPGSEIYTGPTGIAVFTDKFGLGTISALGWDYCCTPPDDPNAILAWYEAVNRAFDQCGPISLSRPIPTLSEWGLIAMAGILGIAGFIMIRRIKHIAA